MNQTAGFDAVVAEARRAYETIFQPGMDQVCDAKELRASPSGKAVTFSGVVATELLGAIPTRICEVHCETGCLSVLTAGPSNDRLPRYSPDGHLIGFLSDRTFKGNFQLHFLNLTTKEVRKAADVEGWVEYFEWSPNGSRILLGAADFGADVAGAQGAVSSLPNQEVADWQPTVDLGDQASKWRRLWVYDCGSGALELLPLAGKNVWDADWCGDDAIVIVASDGPSEGDWYGASVHLYRLGGQSLEQIYEPSHQLGPVRGSADGRYVAAIEGIASDRGNVVGDLIVVDVAGGTCAKIDTRGMDIASVEWRTPSQLTVAGYCDFETLIAQIDVLTGRFEILWRSSRATVNTSATLPAGCGWGDCIIVSESFLERPSIVALGGGSYRVIRSLAQGTSQEHTVEPIIEQLTWAAPDGLEIEGWLVRPPGPKPFPLIMNIHGGPVSATRPAWLGRTAVHLLLLLLRGYALFLPNPRGSSGRGQDFIEKVMGDLGGADAQDLLSGLDHLVDRGDADPDRLGVMGRSYGGFMTSWLVTQDRRFGAAVSISPHTNQVSQHLLSNIPDFTRRFFQGNFYDIPGRYIERSPVFFAGGAQTPILNICGALDRCTPAEEARQFHNAVREQGGTSVLVTYPKEGHGVRSFPAVIDFTARVLTWFDHYLLLHRGATYGHREMHGAA